MSITWYLCVSAIVFCTGVGGVLTRKNPLVVLLSLELMLNAANLALVFAGALLVEIGIAVIGSGLSVLDGEGSGFFPGFGSPAEIGKLFLTKFLLAFEIASLLLLVAAVGAVILARRRSGLDDPRELSVADLLRSDASGTIADAERGSLQEAAGPPGR